MIDPKAIDFSNWGYANLFGLPSGKSGQQQTSITKQPEGGAGGGGAMEMANFQFPKEWGQAGDVWSKLASGNYTNPGMDWLQGMMGSGGNAFDVSGWDKMYRPAMMDQYSNAVKQMAEQAGVGGTRYGSGLQSQIANYGGQLQNKYTQDLWDRMFGAYEAGQGRAYGAGSLLSQLGLGAQQAGAEGLMGLGSQKSQLPMQVASMISGIGQGQTAQQVDPWTQMLMNLLGPTGQATPQTYTPSGFQNLLMSLQQTLPGLFGGTNNKSTGTPGYRFGAE